MFALRNRGGDEAVHALGASFASASSALLKHEVAYVLGQMQDAHAVATLKCVLNRACGVCLRVDAVHVIDRPAGWLGSAR